MSLSALSLIYFSFYTIAVILAFMRAREGTAPKARNSFAGMVIGAVGTILIFVSAILSPGGTVPLVLVAALALFPIFLLGLGNLVGLAIATWRPQVVVQLGLGALALGLPFLAIFAMGWDSDGPDQQILNNPQGAPQEAQRLTVTGRLGRYPIAIPTSPQIKTLYTCLEPGGTLGQCQTDFATSSDLGSLPGGVPIFHQITIASKAADCTAPCLTFRRLAQWCQSRRDVTFAEWCRNAPSEEVTFSYDENRLTDADPKWRAKAIESVGGAFACHTEQPLCRARFEVARNVQVTIWLPNAQTETLAQRTVIAKDYVARLWAEMQSDG